MNLKFEWHDVKAQSNLRRRGVSFDLATRSSKNRSPIEFLDDREFYREDRFVIIGMSEARILLFIASTEREECIPIISARRATSDEQKDYFQQNS